MQTEFNTVGLCQPKGALCQALARVLSHRVKARFSMVGRSVQDLKIKEQKTGIRLRYRFLSHARRDALKMFRLHFH